MLQQLSDSCLVVDALESSVREELVNNFCSRELTSYEQIFEGAGMLHNAVHFSCIVLHNCQVVTCWQNWQSWIKQSGDMHG